jgi:hypothetical protein
MNKKENRGGILKNEQIEQDLKVKANDTDGYRGMQDTGDQIVREEGTQIQKQDGLPVDQSE